MYNNKNRIQIQNQNQIQIAKCQTISTYSILAFVFQVFFWKLQLPSRLHSLCMSTVVCLSLATRFSLFSKKPVLVGIQTKAINEII